MIREPSIRLSRREQEVASLVAEGLTDREIAKRLFLSERTAEGHVQSIRNKLGFDTRAQIAAWYAAGQGSNEAAAGGDVHLPAQLTTFVGRTRELSEVRRLLERTRLLTVTGPAGAGKTRLAVRAAEDLAPRNPGGIWFADLSQLGDPQVVAPAIAAAVGAAEAEGSGPVESAVAHLNQLGRPCLLVLDNCEHLLEPSAQVADVLLRGCRQLRLIATSREPLLADGEAVLKLEPLSLPGTPETASLDDVRRAEAAQLFCERAALSDPAFELSEANASIVASVCRELEGIPLALELAAAQVGILSLEGVRSRLGERLDILRRRSGPERHQTLRAAVRSSYELLGEPERALFRGLAVFRGGFYDDAAGELFGGDAARLSILADKSLLVLEPGPPRRWRLLETIRQFAEELLAAEGELEALRSRHLQVYLAAAEAAAEELYGAEQAAVLSRLAQDQDNFRAALAGARNAKPQLRLRLALALHRFWLLRGHLAEGRAWLEEALAAAGGERGGLRARALNAAAGIAWRQGEFSGARAHLEESLSIRRALDDRAGMQPLLANLGVIAYSEGDPESARRHYLESLELATAAADERGAAILEGNLGLALVDLDQLQEARERLESSLARLRRLSEPALIGSTLINLAIVAIHSRELARARALLQESLAVLAELDAEPELASCLESLAWVAGLEDRGELSLRLAAAAAGVRIEIRAPGAVAVNRQLEEVLGSIREDLGEESERIWAEGASLSLEDAIELGRSAL